MRHQGLVDQMLVSLWERIQNPNVKTDVHLVQRSTSRQLLSLLYNFDQFVSHASHCLQNWRNVTLVTLQTEALTKFPAVLSHVLKISSKAQHDYLISPGRQAEMLTVGINQLNIYKTSHVKVAQCTHKLSRCPPFLRFDIWTIIIIVSPELTI